MRAPSPPSTGRQPRMRGCCVSRVALLVARLEGGCGSPRPSGPVPLLESRSPDSPARGVQVLGGRTEEAGPPGVGALFRPPSPASPRLLWPRAGARRGRAEVQRGFVRLAVRADGRLVGERRLNPRATASWRPLSIPFEGSGRLGSLEPWSSASSTAGASPCPHRPGCARPWRTPCSTTGMRPPVRHGIVFISIDTLRRDHTSLYGYHRLTTPRLDTWARGGRVFDDAVSVSSWTLPAHFSMMTGVDPAGHGATHSRLAYNRHVPTLAALLRARGFTTHAITSASYVSPRYGFDDGFDGMDYDHNRRGFTVAQRAIAFLDQAAERPFFLFLHFYDPHWPYDPPPPLLRLYAGGYAGPLLGKSRPLEGLSRENTTAADLAYIHALYDGEIRYVDEQIGRVFQHLAIRGLEGSTLALVTSDHGEEFLDHGGWAHGRSLYEELIRIPLVLRGPGVPAGKREAAQVSLSTWPPRSWTGPGCRPWPRTRGEACWGRSRNERPTGKRTVPGAPGCSSSAPASRGGSSSTPSTRTRGRRRTSSGSTSPVTRARYGIGYPREAVASSIRRRLLTRWREAARGSRACRSRCPPRRSSSYGRSAISSPDRGTVAADGPRGGGWRRGGIRTPGTGFIPYNRLAICPFSHSSTSPHERTRPPPHGRPVGARQERQG